MLTVIEFICCRWTATFFYFRELESLKRWPNFNVKIVYYRKIYMKFHSTFCTIFLFLKIYIFKYIISLLFLKEKDKKKSEFAEKVHMEELNFHSIPNKPQNEISLTILTVRKHLSCVTGTWNKYRKDVLCDLSQNVRNLLFSHCAQDFSWTA